MIKSNNQFEIIVGTFVIACAAFFFFASFRSAKVSTNGGYRLVANFDNIDGVELGSDVKIAGIKIGSVERLSLDQKDFRAKVGLNLESSVQIPADSSIKVASEGLLGSKYLSISLGADEEFLKNGEEIQFTQSSVNIEDLLGKFIFNSEKPEKNEKN